MNAIELKSIQAVKLPDGKTYKRYDVTSDAEPQEGEVILLALPVKRQVSLSKDKTKEFTSFAQIGNFNFGQQVNKSLAILAKCYLPKGATPSSQAFI